MVQIVRVGSTWVALVGLPYLHTDTTATKGGGVDHDDVPASTVEHHWSHGLGLDAENGPTLPQLAPAIDLGQGTQLRVVSAKWYLIEVGSGGVSLPRRLVPAHTHQPGFVRVPATVCLD